MSSPAQSRLHEQAPLARSRSGAALIVVLCILILVFAMTVAFLNSVMVERTASASYALNLETRQLSNLAVNLVQAQIEHATTQGSSTAPVPWASQPGLVRTFKTDGSLDTAYKLYSDTSLTASTLSPSTVTTDLQNWAENTAHFTDLNEPVTAGGTGTLTYPILNPASITEAGGKSPIIDGFSVTDAPGATARQPVPMPVHWLYVLADGTIASATGTGTTATVSAATTENPIVSRIAFWTDDETSKLNINTAAHGTPWDIPRVISQEEILKFAKYQPAIREFQRFPGHPAMTSLAPVFGHLFGVDPLQPDPYATLTEANEADFANFIYSLSPRVASGGSEFGTQMAGSGIAIDASRRLYASPDELFFASNRAQNATLTPETLAASRFFLTAHSRAPELNLFQRPRISMWPVNNGNNGKTPSSMDRLLAFCSTVNDIPYYLQRQEPDDPAVDIGLAQNQALRDYLQDVMSKPFPGFGPETFAGKYDSGEANQIVMEALDYIRASNIMSVPNYGGAKFSKDVLGEDHSNATAIGNRGGQVSPMVDGNTKGFGRIPTIQKAVLHFYIDDLIDTKSGASLANKPAQPASAAQVASAFIPRVRDTPMVLMPDGGAIGAKYDLRTKAVLYFDFFDPMAGYPVSSYNFDLLVTFTGTWSVTGSASAPVTGPQSLGFPGGPTRIPYRYDGFHGYDQNRDPAVGAANMRRSGTTYGHRLGGGRSVLPPLSGFLGFKSAFTDFVNNVTGNSGGDGLTDFYPLVSAPVSIHPTLTTVDEGTTPPVARLVRPPDFRGTPAAGEPAFDETFSFSGGTAKVQLVVNANGMGTGTDHVIQEFELEFPAFTKPLPAYAAHTARSLEANVLINTQRKQMRTDMHFDYRINGNPVLGTALGAASAATPTVRDQCTNYLMQPGDIVVSLEPAYGDPRLIAGRKNVTTQTSYSGGKATGDFVPHIDYSRNAGSADIRTRQADSVRVSAPNRYNGIYGWYGTLKHPQYGVFINGLTYGQNAHPSLPSRFASGVPVFTASGGPGGFLPDFDTGLGYMQDGAYINRADEGAAVTSASENAWPWTGSQLVSLGAVETFYSPNKQMPGAGMLGSLPTGVVRRLPWQTLLFRPDPKGEHPGSAGPPDYLITDLFWMPVVEPYAISEPFSTAGKINLNHQILPFAYINRDTALRGLLLKEEIPSVRNSDLGSNTTDTYKAINSVVATMPADLGSRNPIDLAETLKAINAHANFAGGGAFRTEAEICAVPLIPKGSTYTADFAYESSWWKARTATGDNLRERPYTNLIPRLTTRSNVYTVHYRVQTLAKSQNSTATTWNETTDQVTGEYRGSTTIERYIDPNLAISSWTDADSAPTLSGYYQWRTLNTTQFAP